MSTIGDVFKAYHALSPRELSFLAMYQATHQNTGDRPDPYAIDFGTISHQRQWMGYMALKLITVYGSGQKLEDNLVQAPLWPVPDTQPPQDIFGFISYPNNQAAAQANPYWTPAERVRARKSYWTGAPRRRRNYTGP